MLCGEVDARLHFTDGLLNQIDGGGLMAALVAFETARFARLPRGFFSSGRRGRIRP
jgi:hypothetical protein